MSYVNNISRYNDATPLPQGPTSDSSQVTASAEPQRKEPTALSAFLAKERRKRALTWALAAMRALLRCEVEPRISPDALSVCAMHYTFATAELAYLTGTLDTFDKAQISDIAELFNAPQSDIEWFWDLATDSLGTGREKCHAAGLAQYNAGRLAIIAHKPLADLKDAARAFNKTEKRDEHLFGPKLIRPTKIDPETGGYAKTKRTRTGMPTLPPVSTGVRGVPDGPGTHRLTTKQRKELADELGIKTKTVRESEQKRTPEEFEKWVDKLRKTAATKARNAAEKAAKAAAPKKRRRKPGKLAAVHRWIEYTAHYRERFYSERQAFRILKGLTTRQILNLIPPAELVYIGGSDGPATTPDVSDKNASHGDIGMHHGGHDHCHDVSDNVSDKNPSHGAFCGTFEPKSIAGYDTTEPTHRAPAEAPSVALQDILNAWASFHAIPDAVTDPREPTEAKAPTFVPMPDPTPEHHAATMANLRAGADDAWAQFGARVGF